MYSNKDPQRVQRGLDSIGGIDGRHQSHTATGLNEEGLCDR